MHLIVPDADRAVVGAGDQVGLVAARVVVDAVDALLVALERKRRLRAAQLPHLRTRVASTSIDET